MLPLGLQAIKAWRGEMKSLACVLALLTALAAAPAEARIWYDYQDYTGSDGGHLVFSLTAGKLDGALFIKVHFHRLDASGPGGTISWGPFSPVFNKDLSGPLDEQSRVRVQGLDMIPSADDDHQTKVEVVGLPEGEYEIDWISLELDNWTPGSLVYRMKFTPKAGFSIKAGRTEYFGNILVIASPGATRVRTLFGSVARWGISRWSLALNDEMDRDVRIASSKADLGPIDRASALDNLPHPPAP